jgi:hypothetical protein
MKSAFQVGGWLIAALISLAVLFIAFRWVALFFLICCLASAGWRPELRKQWFVALVFFGFVLCSFQPVDISFYTRPGPPRIVPVICGKPTHQAMDKAERGELILGGCVVNGFEPDWVLVW